ncbi:MAG: Rieske (2Fe-2S) protein [Bacteroidota bacterium]
MNKESENISNKRMPRRGFMKVFWLVLISISLIEVFSVIIAFLTSGGRKSGDDKRSAMKVLAKEEDISNDTVTAFRSDRVYLVRMEDGGLLALSLQCTHLGCAISWNKDSNEFDCPCHASSFNTKGEVIRPPAPRALDTYPLKIEGGMIKVDLSRPEKRKKFNKSQLVYA